MSFSILTAEIKHETNTFSIRQTGLPQYRSHYLLDGPAAIAARGDHHTELAGFLEAGRTYGWTLKHVLSAAAGPGGFVTTEAFEALTEPLVSAASKGGYHGILLSLHGAMVTEDHPDGEGEILRRLREVVGPDLPIAVTLDPHANVTAGMCERAQIILSYNTYPHVDMRETGIKAADILQRTLTGEITPETLMVRRPMLEEVNGGRTDTGPMITRHALARDFEAQDDVFAVSINAGFASADIAEVGPTVLVTCQGDPGPKLEFINRIADDIWDRRDEVLNSYLSGAEAASEAANWPAGKGLLVIADYADNPGAGAYGDATSLLAALLAANVTEAAFGPLVDSQAAGTLCDTELGETVSISIGGRAEPRFGGGPLNVTGQLLWKGEGRVVGDGPMLDGLVRDFGPTAVLRVAGIDILIVSQPHQMLDLQQFRTFGIDPLRYRVVALKSMQHFRAAFEPIAGRVIVCDSGALCTVRYDLLPYKNVPRPIHGLGPSV